MITPERDQNIKENLKEFANVTGKAVLVLNADVNNDSFQAVSNELAKLNGKQDILLVLQSPGGFIEFAFWIAKVIRGKCKDLDVLVPELAKSAATLIALAADKISLSPLGELGPLDPQMPDPSGTGPRSPLQTVKGLEFLRNYYLETFDVTMFFLLERAGMDVARAMDRATELLAPIADPLYRSINHRELGEASRNLAVSEVYANEVMRRWSPLNADIAAQVVHQGYRIWILRGQLTGKSPFLTAKFG